MIINEFWAPGGGQRFNIEHKLTRIPSYRSIGASIKIPERGCAVQVSGGMTKAWFHVSPPGMYPLYFALVDGGIRLATYKHLIKLTHPKAVIQQAKDGVVYTFDGTLKRYHGQTIDIPVYDEELTPQEFFHLLCQAAEEMYSDMGRPHVLTGLSGGTDGALTALALREIGAKQTCACVGVNENDFDPLNAQIYADKLGLDYQFLRLDPSTEALQSLLEETLPIIEMTDFSNVLMGCCNTLMRREAEARGIYHHFNADFADVIVGNDTLLVGKYRIERAEVIREPATRASWATARKESGLHNLPTNMMIAKSFLWNGGEVHQLFYHPEIMRRLLAAPLETVPAAKDKVLYKATLQLIAPEVPWAVTKKVGYYTGSGIGKLRLENDVLSDQNIRETFKRVR